MSLVLAFALAQAAASPVYGRAEGWTVYREPLSCAAIAEYERGAALAINVHVNEDRIDVTLTNAAWRSIRDDETIRISIQVEGFDPWLVDAAGVNSPGARRGVAFHVAGRDFLAELAAARGIHVARGGRPVVDLSLRGSAAAVALLDRCLEDIRRSPSFDPFSTRESVARASPPSPPPATPPPRPPTLAERLAQRPREAIALDEPGAWITPEDYPEDSLERVEFGTVRYRLAIERDGDVDHCVIVRSSGFEELDERACDMIEDRARFAPALDASGRPVRGRYEGEHRWALPFRR